MSASLTEGIEDARYAALVQRFAADGRFRHVIEAFVADKTEGGRKFGKGALKVNRKLFAFVTRGQLIVKLPKVRVAALVAAAEAEYFDPGHGRLMKEWASITSPSLSWFDLAVEAHDFVMKSSRK